MKNSVKFLIIGVMLGGLVISSQAISQTIKLNPIKPGAKPLAAISDEQQGILAVRKAKASVVNIAGSQEISRSNGDKVIVGTIFGTGFILTGDGYIATNSHVVQDEDNTYYVTLADGKEFQAKVLGRDKLNDIALLKIEAGGLLAATLGNSDDLETGQSVFAIGNSLGKYQYTVTRGVVSGLGRAVNVPEDQRPRLQNLIQTDAAINPGNSGGPLVNMLGEVVGMNTLIDVEAQGIGFAVAINTIKSSTDQIKSLGKVSRPYLGISYQTLTRQGQSERKLPVKDGAYILQVVAGSPAEKAGLKSGDIITAIDGVILNETNELDIVTNKYQAGNQLRISLLRGTEKLDVPLILGEYK